MHRGAILLALVMASVPALPVGAANSGLRGSGTLLAERGRSEDGRFAVSATLLPGPAVAPPDGRFRVTARLAPGDAAKAAGAACAAPPQIFGNGFE